MTTNIISTLLNKACGKPLLILHTWIGEQTNRYKPNEVFDARRISRLIKVSYETDVKMDFIPLINIMLEWEDVRLSSSVKYIHIMTGTPLVAVEDIRYDCA